MRTEEVVCWEVISVPDLEVETRRDLRLRLVPREHVVLACDHDLLLSNQVVEWKHESPIEITFSCQRPVHRYSRRSMNSLTHRHKCLLQRETSCVEAATAKQASSSTDNKWNCQYCIFLHIFSHLANKTSEFDCLVQGLERAYQGIKEPR